MELLRKESLAGLAPAAAARVLSHAYAAVVPIAPLPYPPLPLAPNRPGKHLTCLCLARARPAGESAHSTVCLASQRALVIAARSTQYPLDTGIGYTFHS